MKSRFFKIAPLGIVLLTLAWMAWPKLELFQCRSIQSEAKAWLQHLFEAEKFYYAHHQEYASMEMLLAQGLIKSREINYRYEIQNQDPKHFIILARGKHNDVWSVDQTGEIKSIQNACR